MLLEINGVLFCWQDLKSSNQRDEIAAARASLKENSSLLHSICSACLEHSDVASLTASKDSICSEIQNALNVISNASQGVGNKTGQHSSHKATLGSALDELEVGEPINLAHCNIFGLLYCLYSLTIAVRNGRQKGIRNQCSA